MQKKRAGYAKNHPSFDGEDLEHTEFMKLWEIDLSQDNAKCPRTEDDNGDRDTIFRELRVPEKILRSKKLGRRRRKSSADGSGEEIVIKVTDCGGDAEYVLLSTLSITSKSVNVVVFDVYKYRSHEDNYYSAVGCYLDIILSQTKQAIICIVASHFDNDLPPDHFFKKNGSAELEIIFKEAIKQIKDRTKDWNIVSSKVTLLSEPHTKIFTLSNQNKNNRIKGLTNSQLALANALEYVALNNSIIDIGSQTDGIPNLWIKLHQAMKDVSHANQLNVCSRATAFKLFNDLKKSSAFSSSLDDSARKELNTEYRIISNLLMVINYFEKFPIVENGTTLQSTPPLTTLLNILQKDGSQDVQSTQDLPADKQTQEEHVISLNYPSNHCDNIELTDLDVSKEMETISSSSNETSTNGLSDFSVVLDYHRYANNIFMFDDYKQNMFPEPDAFINSCGLFLARDLKEWKQCIWKLENGIIVENDYDKALKYKKDASKNYVDFEEFKKFMLKMGVMIDYLLCEVLTNNVGNSLSIWYIESFVLIDWKVS